jgi:hypothetical protein
VASSVVSVTHPSSLPTVRLLFFSNFLSKKKSQIFLFKLVPWFLNSFLIIIIGVLRLNIKGSCCEVADSAVEWLKQQALNSHQKARPSIEVYV